MASIAANVPTEFLWSADGQHRMLARNDYTSKQWRHVELNEALERALSNILRHGYDIDLREAKPASADAIKGQILRWAQHIVEDIPGYNSWEEIFEYTVDALYSPCELRGEDDTPVGTEKDLHDGYFDDATKEEYGLLDEATEKDRIRDRALTLEVSRRRLEVLEAIPRKFTPDDPMSDEFAKLLRKIRYAYKLRETVLARIGLRAGSIQLAAGMRNDLDFCMLMIDMKMRRHDRMLPYNAPKPYTCYYTFPDSEMPWNNQFSFGWGFDEFKPKQIPRLGVTLIERRLVNALRHDEDGKRWSKLCEIMSWNPQEGGAARERVRVLSGFVLAEGSDDPGYVLPDYLTLSFYSFHHLTLDNIIGLLSDDEVKRRAFFNYVLGYGWSDTELKEEHNPFVQLYLERKAEADVTGKLTDFTLRNVDASEIRDIRIAAEEAPPLLTLQKARHLPSIAGRKVNFVMDPETAAPIFRARLERMSERDLDKLFSNIPAYPKHLPHTEKIDAVVKQSVEAALAWWDAAVKNLRVIYTAVSGHAMSYTYFYASSTERGCSRPDHPTGEQCRFTLLSDLTGANQHHSYDECMFSCHGVECNGEKLLYKDRVGFRDIILSDDPFIKRVGQELIKSALAIGRNAIAGDDEYKDILAPPKEDWREVVKDWFAAVIGGEFTEA